MRGIAKNTPENQAYLERLDAVESWRETDAEMLQFVFDPSKQPAEVPEGVYFDLTEAPF